MASKRKRRERREAAPVQPATPARPPANRGTFAVARANRVLADQLPDVIHQRSGSPRPARSRQLTLDAAPMRPAVVPVSSAPRKAEGPQPRRQLDLVSERACKTRPGSSKGGGGGRPFVPWCRK